MTYHAFYPFIVKFTAVECPRNCHFSLLELLSLDYSSYICFLSFEVNKGRKKVFMIQKNWKVQAPFPMGENLLTLETPSMHIK